MYCINGLYIKNGNILAYHVQSVNAWCPDDNLILVVTTEQLVVLSGGQLERLSHGFPEEYQRKLRGRRNLLKRRGLGVKMSERTEKRERRESAGNNIDHLWPYLHKPPNQAKLIFCSKFKNRVIIHHLSKFRLFQQYNLPSVMDLWVSLKTPNLLYSLSYEALSVQ